MFLSRSKFQYCTYLLLIHEEEKVNSIAHYRIAGFLMLNDTLYFMYLPFCKGIRVQSLKKGQLIMDIDFRWGGDLSIILAVEALVASLPIQVSLFGCNNYLIYI